MIDMANDSQKPARVMTAHQARKALTDARVGVMHSAYWIAELIDKEGWKALGWDTAEAFAQGELELSRSSLYRILDQGRIIRRLSGGDLKRLRSYGLTQRHAETLKKAPDDLLDLAGERIANGEDVGEVVADVLTLVNPPPGLDGLSRGAGHAQAADQQEHEEDDAQTDAETEDEPDAQQPEGATGEAPAAPEGERPESRDDPTPPTPPEPPADPSAEDEERARAEAAAVKEANKAVRDLIDELLAVDPIVLAQAVKREVLAEVEALAKRAQQADPDHDGSRVLLLAADLVARFPALPSEPFDAGVNRAIRDLLAKVDRISEAAPVQSAPTPPAATKPKPAAVKQAPKPKVVKRPKKGEPCPHPREAHVGVDMRGVTCSWCGVQALTHASLERMGQRAVAAR